MHRVGPMDGEQTETDDSEDNDRGRFGCVVSEDASAMLPQTKDFAIDIQHCMIMLIDQKRNILFHRGIQ